MDDVKRSHDVIWKSEESLYKSTRLWKRRYMRYEDKMGYQFMSDQAGRWTLATKWSKEMLLKAYVVRFSVDSSLRSTLFQTNIMYIHTPGGVE